MIVDSSLLLFVINHDNKLTGIVDGYTAIWYFAVPLTYLEAGLSCSPSSLYSVLKNGNLMLFVITFVYLVLPILAKIATFLLQRVKVDIWLLKGMEVKNY